MDQRPLLQHDIQDTDYNFYHFKKKILKGMVPGMDPFIIAEWTKLSPAPSYLTPYVQKTQEIHHCEFCGKISDTSLKTPDLENGTMTGPTSPKIAT